jgi:ribosomal protein S6
MKIFILWTFIMLSFIQIHAQKFGDNQPKPTPKKSEMRYHIAKFNLPDKKINSKYHSFIVWDSRKDTSLLGIIQKGLLNEKVALVTENSLSQDLERFISLITNPYPNAKDTMLINIREMYFTELTGASSEKGFCRLRAEFFMKKDTLFELIDDMDLVLEIKSMLDVTKRNINNGMKVFTEKLAQNLSANKTGEQFTSLQIQNFEQIQKNKLAAYTIDKLKDGVYFTFKSFAEQNPSASNFKIVYGKKANQIDQVMGINASGKELVLNKEQIYCIVDQGKALISTNFGFYELKYEDGDFCFEGKNKVTANGQDVILAGVLFGVLGGILASNDTEIWLQKIDYMGGAIVPMRKIKE